MRILLTGGSGFLGTTIKAVLGDHEVITLGRTSSDIIADLAKQVPSLPSFDIIVHAAGKAHTVPKANTAAQEFFEVNVKGTENLLLGLDKCPSLPKSFVFISSVAVYGLESGSMISEDAPLLAKDAYGLSKIEAERLVKDWCNDKNIVCTILRLPLVAGPNPPGNLGAMIRGLKKGYYFNVDGGLNRRSIVLAEDVGRVLTKAAATGGVFNLTDGYHPSFKELSEYIAKKYNLSKPKQMPLVMARLLGKIGDLIGPNAPLTSKKLEKLRYALTFDDSKAAALLDWAPQPVLKKFISHI